jgi:hypothetical protein
MTGEWWQGQREISERGIASSRRRASHVGSFPGKRLMEVGNESCGVVVSEVGAERGGHVELGQLAWHGAAHGIAVDGSHHAMASMSSRVAVSAAAFSAEGKECWWAWRKRSRAPSTACADLRAGSVFSVASCAPLVSALVDRACDRSVFTQNRKTQPVSKGI